MREVEWVESIAEHLRRSRLGRSTGIGIRTGLRLAYGHEIAGYRKDRADVRTSTFQTDLVVLEYDSAGDWKPRVVVEAKIDSITTHDAITYSQKANEHRSVYPYLRYGVMLGNRKNHPLPGRLYRHGTQFDFMISFVGTRLTRTESKGLGELLSEEIEASRLLEKLLYESRKRGRDRYWLFRRRLEVR